MQVFGDGPDGGREATFTGTIPWASTALAADGGNDDAWAGYTVIQSKFKLDPAPQPHDNAVWLQGQIKKEIGNWVLAARERTRTRLPDYLIFVTNVDLSAVAKTGGIDTVDAYVTDLLGPDSDAYKAGVRVRAFRIWHGDQIRTMIDAHQDVRWAFDGLLTIGDVLAAFQAERGTQLGTNSLEDPLREDMVAGMSADRWIRLGQAGGPGEAKLHLDDVAVDVPATFTDSSLGPGVVMDTIKLHGAGTLTGAGISGTAGTGNLDVLFARTVRTVRHVLERGDTVLSARQPQKTGKPGVVLVGGPGQGKTTLSQLVAQAYRAALLDDSDLAPTTRTQVDATKTALRRLGLPLPGNRRWPVRVDLAKYAEELASGADTTLLRWLSRLVTGRATTEVTPSQLSSWLRVAPWVVILDGLDEVPSLDARIAVYSRVEELWAKIDDIGADVLMVVTTRPTGYDERLPEDRFQHLHLQPLPPADAAELAEHLSAKRFEADAAMRADVIQRMRAAAADATTARLMVTPLQVTIMSMIVEKYPTLPPDRYTLFNLYYETVLDREIGKGIALSRFLSEFRSHIDRLHERIGLALQVQSEGAAGAEAVLATDHLRRIATDYLLERGFEADEAGSIAQNLEVAALNRLVLLVPRDGGLGFEIRTLQEMMAGRAITAGTDDQSVAGLRLLAKSPHWRNTWLLAAGRLLVSSDRFESILVEVLRALGHSTHSPTSVSPAPQLAADMLSDGLAQRRPAFHRALVQTVLSACDVAPVSPLRPIASVLNTLMDRGLRETVSNRLVAASGLPQRATAAALLDVMERQLGVDHAGRRQTIQLARDQLALTKAEEAALGAFMTCAHSSTVTAAVGSDVLAGPDQSVKQTVLAGVAELDPDGTMTEVLSEALEVLGPVRFRLTESEPSLAVLRSVPGADPSALVDVLADGDIASAIDLALAGLPPGYWPLSALVASTVEAGRSRRRIGPELEAHTAAS
ncbi:MAG: NACHT domain-containing protein [Actinomycetales bacterium]